MNAVERRGIAGRVMAIIAACMLLSLVILPGAASAQISSSDYFEYTYTQKVRRGTGAYHGYRETTESWGKYTITDVSGQNVTAHADYSWTYTSTEVGRRTGAESRTFAFSTRTRKYLSGYDLDVNYGPDPSIWFWVSPGLSQGNRLLILDEAFTVTSTDSHVWFGGIPYRAMVIERAGTGLRNDEYGVFDISFTDRYYFDQKTGFIIAETYEERNEGYWSGMQASFVWTEEFHIVGSSYSLDVDYPVLLMAIIKIILLVSFSFLAIYWLRWRPRTVGLKVMGPVKLKRIRKMEDYPRIPDMTGSLMGSFMEDFARKALLSGGRVAVALTGTGLHGLGIYHRDVRMGALFCPDLELNEGLRKFIGARDFFSETKHKFSDSTESNAGGAYNIFETYRVLRLDDIQPCQYDTGTIRLMSHEDVPAAARISRAVYKVKSESWLKALLDSGDMGFVAEVDGNVVGFAFATICGTHARFHTLTVMEKMRGRGLGKALMMARLHMVWNLGARDALVEIADWNLPSLNISYMFGFRNIGAMYVETVRTKRVKKNIMRR